MSHVLEQLAELSEGYAEMGVASWGERLDRVVESAQEQERITRRRVEHLALPPPEGAEVFVQDGCHLSRDARHGLVAQ